MHHELQEKIKKYLAQLTSQEIQRRVREGTFPFFSKRSEDCEDLAWEVIAKRELKD